MKGLITLAFLVFTYLRVSAQPPIISYAGPQVYTAGVAITTLMPVNTGGIPAINGQTLTIAGSGSAGSSNGNGTAASFNQPLGAASDAQGNIYIADAATNLIRKITPAGVVSTLAGTGFAGAVNGAGNIASFYHPEGLATDNDGNVYVADGNNNLIRKITPYGVVTTLAGTGAPGSADGAAGVATFYNPSGLAFDATGNLYVADNNNNKIRKITPAGVVSTFVGTGVAGTTDGSAAVAKFNQPFSVSFDLSGNLYVADRYNHRIRMVTPAGNVTTLAGSTAGFADGTGTAASFNYPTGIAVDKVNNVYVADYYNNRIRKISVAGVVTTLAGTGVAGNTNAMGQYATFNYPFGLCIAPSGYLFVSDLNTNLIRKVATTAFAANTALPGGISLDPSNGAISGTPVNGSPATNYSITAYNSNGGNTATINIKVEQSNAGPVVANNNTVRTDIIRQSGITDQSQIISAVNAQTEISYMDGLGRPVQRIEQQASPQKKDIVKVLIYDQYGRQQYDYLPYVAASSNGAYQTNALNDQATFYQTANNQIASDTNPWTKTVFDDSPLERVLEIGSPGTAWQPGQHSVKNQFRLNSSSDQIRIWIATGPSAAYYGNGQLTVNDVTDENGSHIMTFTNRLGQVIEKKVQASSSVWMETVWVYDDIGNLLFQVSPEGVKRISQPTPPVFDAAFKKAWVTSYIYDSRGRLISRQVPGCEPVFMVYDKFNRIVLVQDGRMRTAYGAADKWHAFKYDAMNRMILTGLYTYVAPPNPVGLTNQQRIQNYLDGLIYDNLTVFSFEKRIAASAFGYSSQTFPSIADADVLSANYFDDYDFYNTGTASASYVDPTTSGFSTIAASNVRGLLTGTIQRIITPTGNNGGLIRQSYFYDRFGNRIQSQANNLINQNALDITSNLVDSFTGQILSTKQSKSQGNISVINKITYDLQDRILQVAININGTGADQVIAKYDYNELGQLKDKKLGLVTGGSRNGMFLQTVDYRYNIRGWLTSINNSTLSADNGITNGDTDDIFGMNFLYEQTDASGLNNAPKFNGQLSAVKWKTNDSFSSSTNPVRQRSYVYAYDNAGRLTSGQYAANNGTAWNAEINGFNESVNAYDNNGNILSLTRNAFASGASSPTLIDNLTFSFANNAGNQLSKITDGSANTMGFNDGANITTEYSYDGNGNLINDANKNAVITYNDLSKVSKIAITGGGSVEFTYNTFGVKLRKVVYDNAHAAISTTDYIDDFVYESGALRYFAMAEGRVMASSSSFSYEYNIKDNLGSTRVSFKDNGSGIAAISQENQYYPFGMSLNGIVIRTPYNTVANKNLFNGGSELQNDLGFENSYSTMYREYDPVIARFNSIDPAADEYADWSPYNFAFDDPIGLNDPMGDDPYGATDPNPPNWGQQIAAQQRTSSESQWQGGLGPTFSMFDPAVQYIIQNAYNNTAAGTSSTTRAGNDGAWLTVETNVQHDYRGDFYWINENYTRTNTGNDNSFSQEVVISSRKVYLNTGNLQKFKDLADKNTGLGALAIGVGFKNEMIDMVVRTGFKSARTWNEFRQLRETQRLWRFNNILGKRGNQILNISKSVGKVAAVASVSITATRAAMYYFNGGKGSAVGIKAAADIIMTGVGFLGPVGFAVSSVYFLADALTDGFGGYGKIE
ncbi:MAG: DUF6443 domain-containing protein [Bacteroidota bacterium]